MITLINIIINNNDNHIFISKLYLYNIIFTFTEIHNNK